MNFEILGIVFNAGILLLIFFGLGSIDGTLEEILKEIKKYTWYRK